MKSFICLGLTELFIMSAIAFELRHPKKIVCSWDSTILDRQMPNEFKIDDLRRALSPCTHLIYRYVGMNVENEQAVLIYPNIDTGAGNFLDRLITHVRRNFPNLKIYLGIGGKNLPFEKTDEYIYFIQNIDSRTTFVDWALYLLEKYNFDGIDLAWQFPSVHVENNGGIFRTIWYMIKKSLGYGNSEGQEVRAHRHGFTQLVRALRANPRFELKNLTLTVLSTVNVPAYYIPSLLVPHIQAVHLMRFDSMTLKRNPKENFIVAPINDRALLNYHMNYWLENGTPGEKIIFGIPMRVSCILDTIEKYGNYAYVYLVRSNIYSKILFVRENPNSFKIKDPYVSTNRLGGIAILDLSYDDINGTCT